MLHPAVSVAFGAAVVAFAIAVCAILPAGSVWFTFGHSSGMRIDALRKAERSVQIDARCDTPHVFPTLDVPFRVSVSALNSRA